MTIKVYIVVFKYKKDVLYGSIIDLFISYHWALQITSEENIEIITDIDKILFESLRDSITEKIIIPSTEVMENFILKLENIQIKDDIYFENKVYDRVIFYFSGHSSNSKILLPSDKEISFENIKNNLISITKKTSKIFCIFDCCNPPNLNLEYEFKSDFVRNFCNVYVDRNLLLFTSSREDQKSNMKISGSIFTKYIFSNLNLRSFKEIIKEVNKQIKNEKIDQHMNIYSSHRITPIVWNWLIKKTDYDIIIEENNIIILR